MKAATSFKGNLAFDSSVLVEIFSDSELGRSLFGALQDEETTIHTSGVNIAEASYIICRKLGNDRARQARRDLLDSGYITLEEDLCLHEIASGIKCERAIALPDCYTFAVAELTSSVPVFAIKEHELIREIGKKPFTPAPIFLS
ncbi:MAG: PIN domain-containing protein [Nitrososphaerota archaeon]|nr:PIN domain-containing protein [Nitrososphaerota archaeon]